jgi:hypothetical protein
MKKIQLYFAAMTMGIVMMASCGGGNSSDQDNNSDSSGTTQKQVKSEGGNAPIPDLPGWEKLSDASLMFAEWKDDNGIITTIDNYYDPTNGDAGISWSEQMEGADKEEGGNTAKVQLCSSCSGDSGEGFITVTWKSDNKPMCYQYKLFKKGEEVQMLLSLQGQDVVRVFKRKL